MRKQSDGKTGSQDRRRIAEKEELEIPRTIMQSPVKVVLTWETTNARNRSTDRCPLLRFTRICTNERQDKVTPALKLSRLLEHVSGDVLCCPEGSYVMF